MGLRTKLAGWLLLAWLAAAPAWSQPAASSPAPSVTWRVAGLAEPAQILVDPWGVPHLYARSEDDVYFLQGFNAARDRLFQIDLWRRRGLGRLASIFGANVVEQDRAARLFLYRGDMAREWRAYGPRAQRIATRFVAGINAYIDLVGSDPARLPFEFSHFGYRPEKWQPDDVVRIRSHGLTRNAASEIWRAAVACRSELKADEVRSALSPPWQTRVPEGLDPCIAPEALRVLGLATQGLVVGGREGWRSSLETAPAVALADGEAAPMEGSNAWVVAPARSATGRPILASDPHRLHAAPSLRYIVHLSAPGLDVIGGGEPSLPGVSIGHNGHIAFGLTIFAIDQEDLYVYEMPETGAMAYRYHGRWEPMRKLIETVEVRGQPPRRVELLFSRHGPVTHVDTAARRAYAVRSAWFEPGMAPYLGSLRYLHAKDFKAFRAAMSTWGAPAENQVYADVGGHIAWVTGGLAPKRPNWDGLLPVPGDGRYEWAGFWPGTQLPFVLDPEAGWIASANELNLPPGYPYREKKLGFEWSPASRQQRLAEVLAGLPKVSLEDSMRLQNDVLPVPARRLQALLRALKATDPRAVAAARLLVGWNLQASADSAGAALFEVWWSRHLGAAFRQAALPAAAAALIRSTDTRLMLATLEQPAPRWGADATARRDAVLERSLAAAWDDMLQLGGADPARWQWGRLHHSLFTHPLANATDAANQARLNVGPWPKGGGSDTVNLSSYDPGNFRQVAGPSFRMVLDVGAWDNSRAVNAPGQSGDPASPFYRDLAPLWLRGEYFPLLYSRARIEAVVAQRFELLPAQPQPR
ncbi:MAG: penicillin acylase family protein [Leptothrix sp. (in: Bacteria)]|nr:penicillin acylase family protein [Leptothrix sp. (in: b-proteobacteria)]